MGVSSPETGSTDGSFLTWDRIYWWELPHLRDRIYWWEFPHLRQDLLMGASSPETGSTDGSFLTWETGSTDESFLTWETGSTDESFLTWDRIYWWELPHLRQDLLMRASSPERQDLLMRASSPETGPTDESFLTWDWTYWWVFSPERQDLLMSFLTWETSCHSLMYPCSSNNNFLDLLESCLLVMGCHKYIICIWKLS